MTIWKSGLPKALSSPCLPLPLKGMPMEHHTRSPHPTATNFQANTRTGPSRAALDTICHRKLHRSLPKLLSRSMVTPNEPVSLTDLTLANNQRSISAYWRCLQDSSSIEVGSQKRL